MAILGVSKGTIQRNIIEPLQRIWGTKLVGDINSQNICPMFGEDVYCLGAEKVSQVSKIRGSSLKYCYGDEVVDWNQDVLTCLNPVWISLIPALTEPVTRMPHSTGLKVPGL